MTKKVYRAAIIGLGDIGATTALRGSELGHLRGIFGRLSHAAAYHDHPRTKLVCGSSRDAERRARFTRDWGIENVYSDWRQMLETEDIDIVSVATNTPSHAEIVIDVASIGVKAIFSEKPIATTLNDAEKMVRLCEETRTVLVINHTRRWDPTFQRVRDLVMNNVIGELVQIDCSWPTGRLGCLGTHHFDLVRWVAGAEVESIIGFIDQTNTPDPGGLEYCDPGGYGIINFRNNAKAFVNGSEALALPPILKVTGMRGTVLVANNGGHAELWTADEPPLGDAGIAMRQFPTSERKHYPMLAAIEEIVCNLDDGKPPTSTGCDGYAALELAVGFHLSHNSGNQPIKFPLTDSQKNYEIRSR